MHNYLKEILSQKRQEVEQLNAMLATDVDHPLAKILAGQNAVIVKKSLREALKRSPLAVIAEIKRRSPSKMKLADIDDPAALAKQYVAGGAAAVSVLTDYPGFGGSLADLTAVAQALSDTPVAVLRKDFILSEIQIAESILAGADAILLIVAVLQERTAELLAAARRMQIDALVEVHTQAELELALTIGADMVGVNNRDLSSFQIDMNISYQLIKHMPSSVIKIAESGIHNPAVGAELGNLGFDALLIGESLVKSTSPDVFIQELQHLYMLQIT